MRFFVAALFAIACVVPSLAEIVVRCYYLDDTNRLIPLFQITLPIGTTVCEGGQACRVSWEAGQNAPTLQQCGACNFGCENNASLRVKCI